MKWMFIPIILILLAGLVSAGVGIKWDKESALVAEGEKTCLTYYVYNPWPEESNVEVQLSDESSGLDEIVLDQKSETKLIPANTPSNEAIPVEFCFKVPKVYERDCWIGDSFICEQECNEDQKEYSGKVSVVSVPLSTEVGGSGGSTTSASVSAPLGIKVSCDAHGKNYSPLYVILLIASGGGIMIVLYRRNRKPALERDKEKLRKLQDKVRKESGGR